MTLNIDLPWAAALFNLLADSAIALLLISIGRGHSVFQVSSVVLYLAHPRILYYSTGGMEMSLLVLLALGTSWLYWNRRHTWAGLGAALIVMCRIDGILFVGALVVSQWMKDRSIPLRFIGWGVLFFCPWLLFAILYFGSIVPHSAVAKQLWMTHASLYNTWQLYKADWFLLPLALIGAAFLFRSLVLTRANASRLLETFGVMGLWLVFWTGFFMATRVIVSDWYRIPQHTVLVILVAWGLQATWTAIAAKIPWVPKLLNSGPIGKSWNALKTGVVVCAIGAVSVAVLRLAEPPPPFAAMHYRVGLWLQGHARPTETVYAGNIGFIGFYSGCRVLDGVGLVSPEVLPILRQDSLRTARLITTFWPEWLTLERSEYPWLKATIESSGYILEARFDDEACPSQSPYLVFSRAALKKQP